MDKSLNFIKNVISDFSEYAAGFNTMTLEKGSTHYALSQKLIVSYDRIQHIHNVREYLAEHAKIMNPKDMIIIVTAGPMAESTMDGYFEPRTMRELQEGLDLQNNFEDWNMVYTDGNKVLLCWAIKGDPHDN